MAEQLPPSQRHQYQQNKGSDPFSPNNNAAFIQQHGINKADSDDTDSPKENDNNSSNSSGSAFVVLDGNNQNGIKHVSSSSEFETINTQKQVQQQQEEEKEKEEEEKYEHIATQGNGIIRTATAPAISTYHKYPFFSLESGLHSVLTAINLPISSEVLITSLVSPSIIRIIELHGLIAKPIDINLETMQPITPVQDLITNETKLLIIGHLFGFNIDIDIDINHIDIDIDHDILIIEDCSSHTYPDGCGCGYPYSDIKMYQFDATNKYPLHYPMNGALFKFKDKILMQKVSSITNGYSKQSQMTYLWMLIIQYLFTPLKNKFISPIFVIICHILSINYDEWFISKKKNTKEFMSWLETQPSSYLIKMINNKMKWKIKANKNKKKVDKIKKKRAIALSTLTAISNIVIVGKSSFNSESAQSSFDCFPVCIQDKHRKRVINKMRYAGYNVTNGGKSSLISVANSFNCNYFETNVIYLPVHNMDIKSFKKMVNKFKSLFDENPKKKKRSFLWNCLSFSFIIKIVVILFVLRYVWFYLFIVLAIAYYFLRPTRIFRDSPYKGVKQARIVDEKKICAIVTGSTGFLGEVLVKDLLDSYPSEQIKLYLIIRGKKDESAQERATKLFGEYMKKHGKNNIQVIDMELDILNIDDINISSSQSITHIIHCAGNVKFADSHSNIAKINITCTLKLKELSERYNSKFIYISTAFVHGADCSKSTNYLSTAPVYLDSDDISAEKLYSLMLTNRKEINEYMKRHHIENNYVLSKMVAENLIGTSSIIIRPSIIAPAWNFPEPTWGGRTPSTITVVVACVAARLVRAPVMTKFSGSGTMAIIPVDFVTKCIVDNINSPVNGIYLAALNTNSKYNKVLSFWESSWTFTSFLYGMEIITSLEVVVIRLCVMLSAIFGEKMFICLLYIMNEIFAPDKFKHLVGRSGVLYQFAHFSATNFQVSDGITPDISFDGRKYLTMVSASACDLAKKPINDLTSTIPLFKYDFNLMISITNTCFSYILSKTCNKVIIENKSLNNLSKLSDKKNIVLLPTHRSFYDFLLICKICVKYQMYGLSMPLSFATSKFKQSPLIAMCMSMMNTIFIDSGSNNIKNGFLAKKIKQNKDKNNVYQLFIEGSRSRNRQFLKAHHGALSVLAQEMDLNIVPITINYERVPEQNSFYKELDGEKTDFSVIKLLGWFYDVVIRNNVFLGDINIQIGDIIPVKKQNYNKQFFNNLVNKVQLKQMEMTNITKYHIYPYINNKSLKLNVERFLNIKGCKVYSTSISNIPTNNKEIYMLTLQFAHYICNYLDSDTKYWLTNGNIMESEMKYDESDVDGNNDNDNDNDEDCREFISLIQWIIAEYRSFNYLNKSMALLKFNTNDSDCLASKRIQVGDENLGYWGYRDCYFCLKSDKLFFKGSRYEISDKYFDKSISFLSDLSKIPLLRKKRYFPVCINNYNDNDHDHDHDNDDELMTFLNKLFGSKYVTKDIACRYMHGTGHTVSDMLHLRLKNIDFRIPDIVVYPQDENELISLVNNINCNRFGTGICIIPYGGGTNVTHALWCPSKKVEKRKIISVDMSLMNKLIWINRENQTANIMAGITGKKLEKELNSFGFTSGHYPDSYEFSTLGGWIATFASGMKRSKYGNIEEIVIDFEVITSLGLINRNMGMYGRVSAGSNYLSSFYGSEGSLGIIISAVIRLHKLPDIISYDSIVFPEWSDGINMMKMVKNIATNCRPASLRLVDNTQFKLSQTFKSSSKSHKSLLSKLYLTKWKGFNLDNICAATIVYEGTKNEIKIQKNIINKLIKQNNGILGGEESGKAGFNLTFAIAYIRDFLLETFGILAESFETFIPWDKINNFKPKLHQLILNKHKNIGLIGYPFLSSRISQIYNEGVCLYLYYGFYVENINENSLKIFNEMEEFIRQEMMKMNGSISHHHGIGKLRSHILKNISSKEIKKLAMNVKNAFDPNNIFCANNGLLN